MERSVVRKMPDGSTRRVEPYHVCLKGLETAILCRDDEDYDVMVKVLAVCARRHNVIIVTHARRRPGGEVGRRAGVRRRQ